MHSTSNAAIGPIHLVGDETAGAPAGPVANAVRGDITDWLETAAVSPVPAEVRAAYGLDPFYQKYVDMLGIPVVGSARVLDAALIEAAYLARCMLQNVPDVVHALAATPMRIAVMATGERTLDVPEHRDLNFLQYGRCRGVGGTDARPASSCAEENLLSCPNDPYWAENIFVHEFAHTVHQMGLNRVNESFSRLLRQIFEQAMEDGLWHDAEPDSKGDTAAYAAENEVEYWAEGVQSYFGCNSRIRDTSHNDVNGRDRLQEYDPRLYDLIAQMLGDNPWNYVPVIRRWDQPHLRGLDRATLPRFAWLATDPPANP